MCFPGRVCLKGGCWANFSLLKQSHSVVLRQCSFSLFVSVLKWSLHSQSTQDRRVSLGVCKQEMRIMGSSCLWLLLGLNVGRAKISENISPQSGCPHRPGGCRELNGSSTWVQVTEAKAGTFQDLGLGAGDTLRLPFCAWSRAVACSAREWSHIPVPKMLLSGELGRSTRLAFKTSSN